MLILKRLLVWFLEMVCITLLWSLVMARMSRTPYTHGFGDLLGNLRIPIVAVLIFMLAFGFPFTTALARAFVRQDVLWLYPTIATVLFVVHFLFAYQHGGTSPPRDLGAVCASVVFVCTFAGNLVLRKWVNSRGSWPKSSSMTS